jgi:hypothetical protein
MPEKSAPVSHLLHTAADLMDEHGWMIGAYWEAPINDIIKDGEYVGGMMCTEGAIRAASTLIWEREKRSEDRQVLVNHSLNTMSAMAAVAELVPSEIIPRRPDGTPAVVSIPWWNDGHCTSKEDAVTLLRDAAIKTEPDS